MSEALNGMLGQIEQAFAARADSEARMRRFVAKARTLEILRRVEVTGEPVTSTDRGRPVLRLAPYYGDDDAALTSLRGSVLAYHDRAGQRGSVGGPRVSVADASDEAATPAEPPLLLDTHAWILWVDGSNELPASVRRQVQAAFIQARLSVSSISAWEVALLVRRGRLVLRFPLRDWIARSESLAGERFLPLDSGIGIRAVELPDLHSDPADRMIVASAERLGATFVTKDERLRAYKGIATLWAPG